MADAVSKLYAEIGFKVNLEGVKQAQQVLKNLAQEINKINSAAREAAKGFGFIAKKQLEEDKRVRKARAESNAQDTRDAKKQLQEQENEHKRFNLNLRRIYRDTNKIIGGTFKFAKTLKLGVDSALKYIEPSMVKSYDFRKFNFESGMTLANFQKQQRAFASLGINLSAQDIMSDMLNVQRNLTKVALNRGGELAAYKLTDVREGARRGDLNAVIRGIQRGVTENRIDNSMLVQLMDMFGFGNSVEWAMRFKGSPKDSRRIRDTMLSDEDYENIDEAVKSANRLSFAFENLRDNVAARLSPTITDFSVGLKRFFEDLAISIRKGEFDELFTSIKKEADNFLEWLKDPSNLESVMEQLKNGVNAFITAIDVFARIMNWVGKKFGIIKESGMPERSMSTTSYAYHTSNIGKLMDSLTGNNMTKMDTGYDYTWKPENIIKNSLRGNTTVNTYNVSMENNITASENSEIPEKTVEAIEQVWNQKGIQVSTGRDRAILIQSGTAGASSARNW